MQDPQFRSLRENLYLEADQISDAKCADYAHDKDRLANFKRNGQRLGACPEFVLGVYMNKHQDSIDRVILDLQAGQRLADIEASEPIRGRILDAINYLILLEALLEERRETGR